MTPGRRETGWLVTLLAAAALGASPAAAHFPHDVIAEVAVSGDGADAHIVAQYLYPGRGLLLVSEDGGRSWSYTAPAVASVVLESLDAAADGTLFATDALTAAPRRSDDGGWTWSATSSPDGSLVRCAVPSPTFGQTPTVFACAETGLFRSDDGGETWSPVDDLPGSVVDVAPAPAYPDDPTLFVLTGEAGLWRTSDDGGLWLPVALPDDGRATSVSFSPGFETDGRVWAGMSSGAVLASEDRGQTWSVTWPDPDGELLDQPIHDVVALTADRVLAITADHAVLCSDDGGAVWELCEVGIPRKADQHSRFWGHYRRLERPAGGNSPVALAAWEGLVLGKEAGSRWSEACVLSPDYVRAVAFSPGYPRDPTLWIGTYGGGVHASVDGGLDWEVLAGDKEHLFTEALTPSPGYPDHPYLFVVSSRRLLRTDDAGASFRQLYASGIALAHDVVLSPGFADDGVAYAIGTADDEGQWVIAHSTDFGESWSEAWRGDESGEAQIVSLAISPGYPDDGELFGIQDDPPAVLRSRDEGGSWEELLELDDGDALTRIVFAGDVLVAVTEAGVVWRAEGDSWATVADLERGVVGGRAFAIADQGSVVYLSVDPPGLLRSFDGGLAWEEVTTPFSSLVLDLAVPPDDPQRGTLVASTHYGTFVTCDDGDSWQLLGRLLRMEDGACPLRYEGEGWHRVAGHTGALATRSHVAGDAMEIEFSGRRVRWLASRFPDGGAADVFVDGTPVARVDLRDATEVETDVVFEHQLDVGGDHSLRLEVVGDGEVEVDAIEVIREQVSNGAESYAIGDWCIDLPEANQPIVITAVCCPDQCDQGARTGTLPTLALGIGGVLWIAGRRGRRRG
jgi:photosystem II stability/assembly factor-like uncharacterized protein